MYRWNWSVLPGALYFTNSMICIPVKLWLLCALMAASDVAATTEWPCSKESVFEAAVYKKTEKDVNQDPRLYFPPLLHMSEQDVIPSKGYPDAHVSLGKNVRAKFMPKRQQVKVEIPIQMYVTKPIRNFHASHSEFIGYHKRRVSYPCTCNLIHIFCLNLCCGTCHRHEDDHSRPKYRYYNPSGCDGNVTFSASGKLIAEVSLQALQIRWQDSSLNHRVEENSVKGNCKDYQSEISNFPHEAVVQKIQDGIASRWKVQKTHRVDLGSGATLFLHFETPPVISTNDETDASALIGTVKACLKRGNTFYQPSSNQKGLLSSGPSCHTKQEGQTVVTTHGQPKKLHASIFQSGGVEGGFSNVSFTWKGSPHVVLRVNDMRIEITKHETSTQVVMTPKSASFVRQVVKPFISEGFTNDISNFMNTKPATQKTMKIPQSGDVDFVLLVQPHTKRISLHSGKWRLSSNFQDIMNVEELEISSTSKAIWNFNAKKVSVCSKGLYNGLEAIDSAVRISTLTLEGLFWAQARAAQELVSDRNDTLRDATLDYSLNIKSFSLRVMPPNSTPQNSLLELSIASARTVARCSKRQQPLWSASTKMIRNHASVVGKNDADGSLLIFVGFETQNHLEVNNFLMREPSIPLSPNAIQSHAKWILSKFIPDINANLEALGLKIPKYLARYIPCTGSGRNCTNLVTHHVSMQENDGGYIEFREGDSPVSPLVFSASDPSTRDDIAGFFNKIRYYVAKFCSWLTVHTPWIVYPAIWLLIVSITFWFSPMLGISVIMLTALWHGWQADGPFTKFTEEALQDLGFSAQYGTSGVASKLKSWNAWCILVTWVEMVCVPFLLVGGHLLAKILTSCGDEATDAKVVLKIWLGIIVIASQFLLLVGMPMVMLLGRELGTQQEPRKVVPDAAIHVAMLFVSSKEVLHNAAGTAVSCSFTAMFVCHLGLHFVFLLLAIPPGIFLGTMAYTFQDWKGPNRNNGSVTLILLMTELVLSAAILGPFVIAYQTLNGTLMWWMGYVLVGLCRPLFAVPACRLICNLDARDGPSFTIFAMGISYLGSSICGGVWMFQCFNDALDRLKSETKDSPLHLGPVFIWAMSLVVMWFAASTSYLVLDDVDKCSGRNCQKITDHVEMVSHHVSGKVVPSPVKEVEGEVKSIFSERWLEKSWTYLFPWVLWLLEMDALASLLYHLFKVVWLANQTGFFMYAIQSESLLYPWQLEPQLLKERLGHLPKLDLEDADHLFQGWLKPCPILCLCFFCTWVILRLWRKRGPVVGMVQTRDVQDASAGRNTSLSEPFLGEKNHENSNQELARTLDYRSEFLLVGLGHALLVFVRQLLYRDSSPHTWGIVPSHTAAEVGLSNFHKYLISQNFVYDDRAGTAGTVLDKPWLEYQWFLSLSLTLQLVFLVLIMFSLLFEHLRMRCWSQACSFLGGAIASVSMLCVLVPNYAGMTQLPKYFLGCGKEFDSFMQFTVSGVLGMIFSVALSCQIMGVLFSIPVSAVRGVWCVMLHFEDNKNMTKVLSCVMWLLAVLIPFVTVFTLMFFNQLTEDTESRDLVISFWAAPSLLIFLSRAKASKTWFYFVWICSYFVPLALFLYQQVQNLNIHMEKVLSYIDIPLIWSMMHADFCITNVIITDLILLVLDVVPSEPSQDHVAEHHWTRTDIPLTCLAVKESLSETDVPRLPGLLWSRNFQGLCLVRFDTEESVELAAKRSDLQCVMVPLRKVVPEPDLHQDSDHQVEQRDQGPMNVLPEVPDDYHPLPESFV